MLERRGKETVVYPNGTGKRGITFKPVNAPPRSFSVAVSRCDL